MVGVGMDRGERWRFLLHSSVFTTNTVFHKIKNKREQEREKLLKKLCGTVNFSMG